LGWLGNAAWRAKAPLRAEGFQIERHYDRYKDDGEMIKGEKVKL